MATVKAMLTKIFHDAFPEFGVFEFTDLSGNRIVIHEKLSVIGMNADGLKLPADVGLECSIISSSKKDLLIDTSEPHAIVDIRGQTRFHVSASIVRR